MLNDGSERVELERFKFMVQMAVDEQDVSGYVKDIEVNVIQHADFNANRLVYQLRASIFGEQLDRIKIKYPRTWQDGAREDLYNRLKHWPRLVEWARKHWPVQYTIHDIDIKAIYPVPNVTPGVQRVVMWNKY